MYESLLGIDDNTRVLKVRGIIDLFEVAVIAVRTERVNSQDVRPEEQQIGFIRNARTFRFLGLIGENPEAFVVGLNKKAIKGIDRLGYSDIEQLIGSEFPNTFEPVQSRHALPLVKKKLLCSQPLQKLIA